MKKVITTPNAAEAHVALATLESAGIDAVIQGEFATLELGPITRPSVWVRDEDYAEACKTLGVVVESVQSASSKGPSLRTLLLIAIVLLVILWLQRGFVR
jgi:hypothetical protein